MKYKFKDSEKKRLFVIKRFTGHTEEDTGEDVLHR